MRAGWAVIAAVLACAACGHPGGSGDPDGAIDGDGPMGDAGDGWKMLIQRSWSTGTNSEAFFCRRQPVTEDMYISGFRALAPAGTYYALLSITTDTSQTGNFNCNATALQTSLTPALLFGAGNGANDLLFPQGVAVKIPAGSTLQLYLHVLNLTPQTLGDTSGVLVKTIPASDVVHEAEMRFVGKTMFTVPATGQPYSIGTDCGASGTVDWHIVGLWPHMHSIATHQKIEILHNAIPTKTELDTDYSVTQQKSYAMDFLLPINDRLKVTCTWVNNTGMDVMSGDSAAAERCYLGAYMYPKLGDPFACINL